MDAAQKELDKALRTNDLGKALVLVDALKTMLQAAESEASASEGEAGRRGRSLSELSASSSLFSPASRPAGTRKDVRRVPGTARRRLRTARRRRTATRGSRGARGCCPSRP